MNGVYYDKAHELGVGAQHWHFIFSAPKGLLLWHVFKSSRLCYVGDITIGNCLVDFQKEICTEAVSQAPGTNELLKPKRAKLLGRGVFPVMDYLEKKTFLFQSFG